MFGRGKTLLAKDEDIGLLTLGEAIDSRMVGVVRKLVLQCTLTKNNLNSEVLNFLF